MKTKIVIPCLISLLSFTLVSHAENKASAQTAKHCLSIPKMHCDGCVDRIGEEIEKVKGVKNSKVSLETKSASFELDSESKDLKAVIEAVKDAGYEATPTKCM